MEQVGELFRKVAGVSVERPVPKLVPVTEKSPGSVMSALSIGSEIRLHRNEDAYFLLPNKDAFGVFDGVTNSKNGQLAAKIARDFFTENIGKLFFKQTVEEVQRGLVEMMLDVADLVSQHGKGGSTTASVVKIFRGIDGQRMAVVVNIGDSRVYLYNREAKKLALLTVDDNGIRKYSANENEARVTQTKIDNVTEATLGQLTATELKAYHERNKLTQCLGGEMVILPRVMVIPISQGDVLLGLTDGISDNFLFGDMQRVIEVSREGGYIVRNLVHDALSNSRRDAHERVRKNSIVSKLVSWRRSISSKPHRPSKPDDMTVVAMDIL